jgi:predicted aspartyl protease
VEGRHIGGADGVLGIDALQGQRVLLDFAARRMTIATPQEAKDRAGYEIVVRARARHGQLIITDARIDGVRTIVVIDTGAQMSFGNEALARRLRARRVDPAELYDINGAVAQGHLHVAGKAKIGQMDLRNLPIMFTPSPAFHALDLENRPAMILGMRELRLFRRIAIDFQTRRILFDMPSSSREFAEGWERLPGS